MVFARKLLIAVMLMVTASSSGSAQNKLGAETRNAALRYWMAFAEMQDVEADQATAELLQKTLTGEAAWNEAKLGRIVDDNAEAIQIMQRATKLPDCDWGLEYSLGPRTPIPFVKNSSRALARLNTLFGIRLAARGDTQNAVDTWLAGIRFSEDLAKGGSLLATLTATSGLIPNLHALTNVAQSGALNAAQRQQVAKAVRVLPETGFDWGLALWYDAYPINIVVREMAKAPSPEAYYRELMNEPAPATFSVPSTSDLTRYYKLLTATEEALRLPPKEAEGKLKSLQNSVETLHPILQRMTPSFIRINDGRVDVETARQNLLKVLAEK
jgi:hypothetical protein